MCRACVFRAVKRACRECDSGGTGHSKFLLGFSEVMRLSKAIDLPLALHSRRYPPTSPTSRVNGVTGLGVINVIRAAVKCA